LRWVHAALLLAYCATALAQFPPSFPGLQRPAGDPAVVERGRQIYDVHCRLCHGTDLRGGDMGGPNLLRSPLVLGDKAGETMGPVIRNGRVPEGGGRPMPPLPLPDADLDAVAEYIHSVVRAAPPQGAPPAGAAPELNLLVGDARRGERFFRVECTTSHSATADLAGIGARLTDIEQLQNSWVAGRRLGPVPATRAARQAQVTVRLSDGSTRTGRLERLDDFMVSLRSEDGVLHSHPRRGRGEVATSVSVEDPMAGHRRLWLRLTNGDMHDVTAYLATLK
jgi:cytochrome c oxidase cbb3-type subunit 3